MTYVSLRLRKKGVKPGVDSKGLSSERLAESDHGSVADELPDDATLITQVLFDIRTNTDYIIDLLEEDDGEEEAADA
jgi:hypothetical protein